jgi:hypothetical protein
LYRISRFNFLKENGNKTCLCNHDVVKLAMQKQNTTGHGAEVDVLTVNNAPSGEEQRSQFG